MNRIWRAYGGRIILSAAAREYIKAAANALPMGRCAPPLKGRLKVELVFFPPTALRGVWDIANREKLLCDTLTKQRVWLDDSQIDSFVMRRGAPTPRGRVDVTIEEVD